MVPCTSSILSFDPLSRLSSKGLPKPLLDVIAVLKWPTLDLALASLDLGAAVWFNCSSKKRMMKDANWTGQQLALLQPKVTAVAAAQAARVATPSFPVWLGKGSPMPSTKTKSSSSQSTNPNQQPTLPEQSGHAARTSFWLLP